MRNRLLLPKRTKTVKQIFVSILISRIALSEIRMCPFGKTGIRRLPKSVCLRQIPPPYAAPGGPEHPVQHHSVILSGTSVFPHLFRWQQWFYPFPLFFCYFRLLHMPILAQYFSLGNFIFQMSSGVCFKTSKVTKRGRRQGRQPYGNRAPFSHTWWKNDRYI